jgi:hypothetical protein
MAIADKIPTWPLSCRMRCLMSHVVRCYGSKAVYHRLTDQTQNTLSLDSFCVVTARGPIRAKNQKITFSGKNSFTNGR